MEQSQDAGIAVQPVVRDLAVAEESYQRNLPERLLNEPLFRTPRAEQVLAAGDAGIVKRAAQAAHRLPEALQHLLQIDARRLRVALAEKQLRAGLHWLADGDQLA